MADELLRALGKRHAELPASLQDEESETAQAMLRPFDGDERAGLLDSVFDTLDRESAPEEERESDEPESDESESDESESEPGVAPVLPLETRRWPTVVWAGSVAALAAAVLLWLGSTQNPDPPSGQALPPYATTRLDGGTAAMRSAETSIPSSLELSSDSAIDWIFSPRSPVRTPVTAVFLATHSEHSALLLRPEALEVSAEGAIRLRGAVSEQLPLSAGTWSIHVLVGAPSQIPESAEAAEAAVTRGDWSPMTFEVKIIAAP